MKFILTILISAAALISGCSVPNLEPEACTEARGQLKKLYSLHFGNLGEKSEKYQEQRDGFISQRLKGEIDDREGFDYLTQTSDFPKAFRIGKCSETGQEQLSFGVLLFWKDTQRDEQREIDAQMSKENGRWVVERVKQPN